MSSYTGGQGNCVQARTPSLNTVELGDTKTPDGPTLLAPNPEWSAFVQAVKATGLGH